VETFLFLEGFKGLEKFGSALVLNSLFVADPFEEFLGVGSNLTESSSSHVLVNFFPIFSIALDQFFKEVGLSGAPAAVPFFSVGLGMRMLSIHTFWIWGLTILKNYIYVCMIISI
jgi:hypothetical protein